MKIREINALTKLYLRAPLDFLAVYLLSHLSSKTNTRHKKTYTHISQGYEMNSGFNDDLDWASTAASSGFTPTSFGATTNVSKISGAVNEEFLDDFDDDDDAFFSSAVAGGASTGPPSNGGMKIDTKFSTVEGGKKGTTGTLSSFGMMALSYGDASAALVTPPNRTRPTSNQGDADNSGEDDISDDSELMDLDQKYLSQLRATGSSFRDVARSCLVCQQLTQSPNNSDLAVSSLSSLEHSIKIQSSAIYHVQRYQRLTHRVLSSLTTCISTHTSSVCKSLAATTLASIARASYARLHFDARLFSVRLPPSIATRLEDECGNGAAHTLVVAAIEQGDDAVSSASFEALGRLTLDPDSDELAAEVRSIADNANNTVFAFETDSGTLESFYEMREMQSKIWENVLFPRMQRVLHRLSMYSSCHHLAKALPVITAAFVHALTQGPDTVPARRTLQCGKTAHAKRGWVESDAERLVAEFVDRILLPCFVQSSNNKCDRALKRSAAVACIRLSSACPLARWRVSACRNVTLALSQQLDEMMTSTSSQTHTILSYTTISGSSSATVALETLSGTAAILLIALRGIPVNERTPGLASVLRSALLFLPSGTTSASDLVRLCSPASSSRIGLLVEVALSMMLDGSKDIGPTATEEMHHTENGEEMAKIVGTRSLLMNRIFQESSIAALPAVDELMWVFCSIFLQIGENHNFSMTSDLSAAADWSNIGLVLLDNFASFLTDKLSNSPFATAASNAYSKLLTDMLKRSAVFPPSSFSISNNMFAAAEKSSTGRSVVGVPVESSSRDALTLFKLTQALTSQRSKMFSINMSFESAKMNVQLNAILCDAWFGHCIANNDAKQSNQGQLVIAFDLLSLFRSDMMTLLQMVGDDVEKQQLGEVLHLLRVCVAGVETVACVSEVISYGNSPKTSNQTRDETDEKVGAAAISTLSGVFTTAKEITVTSQQGSRMCQQVALDSNTAASRISGFTRGISQFYHDDIMTALQSSNLGRSPTSSGFPSSEPASYLYHHARLALDHRGNLAITEFASTTTSSLSSKSIRPFNPLRMRRTFSNTSIQVHQLVRGLPLLIPERADDGVRAVSLTGSSDPVSLIMSPSMRRVRKSDSSESMVLVITMRLYNITAVPLQNGVRLDVAFDEEGDNSVCTSSLYKHEIGAGDCITWEIVLGDWKVGDISLRATVTFIALGKESITHKWLHGGEPADDLSGESPLVGDDDEGTMDVAIPCEPTTISSRFTLQPCPFVFFCGHNGDINAFNFLWGQLEHKSVLMFMKSSSQKEADIDAKKGRVTLSSDVSGCAFIAPGGDRILCMHQINRGGSHSLGIKSNSSELMSSLVGTLPLKTSFLRFVFGENVSIMDVTKMNGNNTKHDFPSITMKHSPINAI